MHWILKTALLLAGFYSFFLLFMRKTTFFRFNRVILLTGTVLCLLLPLVRINVELSGPLTEYLPVRIVLPEMVVGGEGVTNAAAGGWDWKALLLYLRQFHCAVSARSSVNIKVCATAMTGKGALCCMWWRTTCRRSVS